MNIYFKHFKLPYFNIDNMYLLLIIYIIYIIISNIYNKKYIFISFKILII